MKRKQGRPPTPAVVLRERRRQRRAEGREFTRRRRALGLTQEDVARALGVRRQGVSAWELGGRVVRREKEGRVGAWEWILEQERGGNGMAKEGNREGKGGE